MLPATILLLAAAAGGQCPATAQPGGYRVRLDLAPSAGPDARAELRVPDGATGAVEIRPSDPAARRFAIAVRPQHSAMGGPTPGVRLDLRLEERQADGAVRVIGRPSVIVNEGRPASIEFTEGTLRVVADSIALAPEWPSGACMRN